MDAVVARTLEAIATEQDEARRGDLMEESGRALGAHFARHAPDMEELAYDLLNRAWNDAMAEDITPRIIDVKTVSMGETDFVDEDLRGLRAYWQGKGGQIESDILRYTRSQMPREEMATAIDLHRDEVALEFWGTFAKLQAQAEEKLRQLPVTRLVQLIQAGITAGSTFGTFAASTLADTQIDPILDFVSQRSKGNISIIGSRTAIRALSSIGVDFGNNIAERIFNTGQVGVYKGYPLIEVENFEDFAGNLVLPINELWIVGQNAGRLTYFGGDAKVQQLARSGFYVRWETARDAGMLLYGIGRGRIGRIVLT